jgi:hypothetical protein
VNIREFIEIATEYFSDYVWIFFETLRSPKLLFQPLQKPVEQQITVTSSTASPTERDFILNHKLWSFVLINIFIGSIINALIPGRKELPGFPTIAVTVMLYWFLYSSVIHLICRLFKGRGSYAQTLSVGLQLLGVIHVLSSFAALLWGMLVTDTPIGGFIGTLGYVAVWLADNPIYMYFIFQFGLLCIYVPLAARKVHRFKWWSTY